MRKLLAIAVIFMLVGPVAAQNQISIDGVQVNSFTVNASVSIAVTNKTGSAISNVPLLITVTDGNGDDITEVANLSLAPANATTVFVSDAVFDFSSGFQGVRAESSLVTDTAQSDNVYITASPASLPYLQNFAVPPVQTVYQDDSLVSGFQGFSYLQSNSGGRLAYRTDFDPDGDGMLSLDNPGGGGINELILTFDGAQGEIAADGRELLLDFSWHDHGDEGDTVDKVSVRGGPLEDWIVIYDFAANSANGTWTNVKSINLSELLDTNGQSFGGQTQLRFVQTDNFPINTDGISIDDVVVAQKEDDVGVIDVDLPGLDVFAPSATQAVRVVVKNYTTVALTDVPIEIEITQPNGLPVFLHDTVPNLPAGTPVDPLNPDGPYVGGVAEVTYTLTPTADLTGKIGEYVIMARTVLPGDPNAGNDQATFSLESSRSASIPVDESFESVGPGLSYTGPGGLDEVATLIEGIIGWTHVATVDERAQFSGGNAFTGSQSARLDDGNFDENKLVLSIDAQGLDVATDKVMFEAMHLNVGGQNDAEDGFFVRGSESDSYELVFDWHDGVFGTWRSTGLRDISQILRTAGAGAQAYSGRTQIKLQQSDNVTFPTGGAEFDDVRFYRVPHYPLSVDQFDTNATVTATATDDGVVVNGGNALGGELDIVALNSANVTTVNVVGGRLIADGLDAGDSVVLTWDGPDGDFNTLDVGGLNGADLTLGGLLDGLELAFDGPIDYDIEVYSSPTDISTFSEVVSDFDGPGSGLRQVPFASFSTASGSGADFSSVGAIVVTFGGGDGGLAWVEGVSTRTATLEARLVDDADGDLVVSVGDTLEYSAKVLSPETDLTTVVADFTLDPALTLEVGSVSVSQGNVLEGNGIGDASVEVFLGTVVAGLQADLTFRAEVTSAPGAVTQVTTTGQLSSTEFTRAFDDPVDDTSHTDPTVTPVALRDVRLTLADALFNDEGDGVTGGGDTLRYTAQLTNAGNIDEECGTLVASPGPEGSVVNGSVTSTAGMILVGNRAGDSDIGIDLGVVGADEAVTITWDVLINEPLGVGMSQTSSQATLTARMLPTTVSDDPDTPAPDDATVTALFTAPDLVADAYTIDEDSILVVNAATGLLQNDDGLGGALTVTAIDGQMTVGSDVSPAAGGTLNVAADGSFSYDPGNVFDALADGASASVIFTYTADNTSASASESVEITVTGVDDVLTAASDDFVSLEDMSVSGNVLVDNGNGVDQGDDGDEVIVVTTTGTLTAAGIGGEVVLSANGDFTYTPPADVSGVATFNYGIDDGGAAATGLVTITVTPVNDAPTFTPGRDILLPSDASLTQTFAGWATAIGPGAPDETADNLQFVVSVQDDPNGIIDVVAIDPTGELSFTLTGVSEGSALISVRLTDDGGVSDGGQDTSPTRTFEISLSPDAIFQNGFE